MIGDSVVGVFINVPFLGTAYLLIFVNLVEMTWNIPRSCSQSANNVYKSWPLDIKTKRWKESFSDPLSISNQVGMKYKINRKNRYLVLMAMRYFFHRSTKVSAIYTRITQENWKTDARLVSCVDSMLIIKLKKCHKIHIS